jgi:hypothetical protein
MIDDEGVCEGADIQELVPIGLGPGEARGFQGEDRPHFAQPDRGHELVEVIPVLSSRPAFAKIAI